MSYATMDHAAWAESNNAAANRVNAKRRAYKPAPEQLSAFQAKVIDICGMVGSGIYNAPINWEKIRWGSGSPDGHGTMSVPWRDGTMSTYDYRPLTLLVLLCHEARIRCEIRAKGYGHFELMFHERAANEDMVLNHPSIDEAVAHFRAYLPEDHRIRYRIPAEEVAP